MNMAKYLVYLFINSIKGHQQFLYTGDRTKEELLPYATRMSGPPVTAVTRSESVDMLKAKHDIFFAYVGKQDGALWDTYHSVAENYQPHGYFFATTPEIATKHFTVVTSPAVMVYKERKHFNFPRKNRQSNLNIFPNVRTNNAHALFQFLRDRSLIRSI